MCSLTEPAFPWKSSRPGTGTTFCTNAPSFSPRNATTSQSCRLVRTGALDADGGGKPGSTLPAGRGRSWLTGPPRQAVTGPLTALTPNLLRDPAVGRPTCDARAPGMDGARLLPARGGRVGVPHGVAQDVQGV